MTNHEILDSGWLPTQSIPHVPSGSDSIS